jgi:hypothetical protein
MQGGGIPPNPILKPTPMRRRPGIRHCRTAAGALFSKPAAAAERAEALRPVFAELSGLSARKAAEELNRRDIPTAAGRKWHAVQVIRVRERLTD